MNTLLPDPIGCDRLCAEVRTRAVGALRYMMIEPAPPPEAIAAGLDRNLGLLAPEVMEPALFGLHARMRDSLLADDAESFENCRSIFAEWQFTPLVQTALPALRPLRCGGAPNYDQPEKLALIRTLLSDDCGLTTELDLPGDEQLAQVCEKLARAGTILMTAAPDWGRETFALVREVVLATSAAPENRQSFAGGSVFDLFGAILFNAASERGLAHFILTLVHESSHQRLFCHNLADALVLNDSAARYPSPLRRQPRPMEGIYHAAWVSARMVVAGEAILAAPSAPDLMTEAECGWLRRRVEDARAAFTDAHSVVREHGRLTPFGARLMQDAEAMVLVPEARRGRS